jgi:outer membrane protein
MNSGYFTLRRFKEITSSFSSSSRAEIRFNAGGITSVDYLIAKNNLNRAKGSLIIAKCVFVLREKVLNYCEVSSTSSDRHSTNLNRQPSNI